MWRGAVPRGEKEKKLRLLQTPPAPPRGGGSIGPLGMTFHFPAFFSEKWFYVLHDIFYRSRPPHFLKHTHVYAVVDVDCKPAQNRQ